MDHIAKTRTPLLGRGKALARLLCRSLGATRSVGRVAWLISLLAAIGYLIVELTGAGTEFVRLLAGYREHGIHDILLGMLFVGAGALAFSIWRWRDLRRELFALRSADDRLDRALANAGIGTWEYDVSANRYTWSRQMYRLRGFAPGSLDTTSSAVAAYVHPDDEPRVRQLRDDLRDGVGRGPVEARVIHPSGAIRVLRFEGQPTVESDGSIRRVSGIAQDVTDQQLVQRQFAQAQKMQVIGHLAGGMAHDFNNMLGIVIANLEFLEDRLAGDPAAEELRRDALSGALHGADLTHRLLAFARRQPLQPQNVDVNELIRSTSRLLVHLLGEHIELDLRLDPTAWTALVDPAQLEAALTNLASNARDAMQRGGRLTIATSNLQVASRSAIDGMDVDRGDYILLDVSDTGVGIAQDIIGNIFDPFFTTKERGEASGLGLSMVLGFVEQSGGRVAVRSEPGKGTTFSLYLPRSPDARRAVERSAAASGGRAAPGTLDTVLVVEDNTALRRTTVRQLVELGYRVFEAPDAQTATTVLRINGAVRLLLTDVVLPGSMDGIELVAWARVHRPDLCCLLTSGFTDLEGHEQRLEGLGCEFLKKPYRREELARAVREAIARCPGMN